MANSWSASPAENSRPPTPATHTPKALGDAAARAGISVGDRPLAEMAIALVAGRDDGLHVSIGRERPSRHVSGLRVVAGEGIVVHVHPRAGECCPGSHRGPGSAGLMVSVLPIRNKPGRPHEPSPPMTCRDQAVAIRRENRRDLGKGERGRGRRLARIRRAARDMQPVSAMSSGGWPALRPAGTNLPLMLTGLGTVPGRTGRRVSGRRVVREQQVEAIWRVELPGGRTDGVHPICRCVAGRQPAEDDELARRSRRHHLATERRLICPGSRLDSAVGRLGCAAGQVCCQSTTDPGGRPGIIRPGDTGARLE